MIGLNESLNNILEPLRTIQTVFSMSYSRNDLRSRWRKRKIVCFEIMNKQSFVRCLRSKQLNKNYTVGTRIMLQSFFLYVTTNLTYRLSPWLLKKKHVLEKIIKWLNQLLIFWISFIILLKNKTNWIGNSNLLFNSQITLTFIHVDKTIPNVKEI